jgi:hypothetical protein
MKTGPDALGTAENESGIGKHENGIRRPKKEYGDAKQENRTRRTSRSRKRVRERKTRIQGPTATVPPKMCPGAQSKETGPDALGTAEKESGSAKHENGTRRPPHYRKHFRERTPMVPTKTIMGTQNIKMVPNAIQNAVNVSGSEKHENGTRRPRYRRKRVPESKT